MAPREPTPLAATQRELAALLTAPEGVRAAPSRPLDDWLRSARGVPAADRLAVYANAYFARIHDVLRDDFGALHAALGDDAFHDLVRLYLLAHPSRSWSLRHVGRHMEALLRSGAAEAFAGRWPFAADLAALEWAIADVFDAPDAAALARDELAALPPERWHGLRFELAPAQRLLLLAWPVQRLREAHDAGLPLPAIGPEPGRVLVWRQDERVFHRALTALEADALAGAARGASFGELCLPIAAELGDDAAPPRALAFLERWLCDGLLARLSD